MATAKNTNIIRFPVPTTSANTDATHWGLWDAASNGNFLYGGALSGDPAALTASQAFSFASNALIIAKPAIGFLSETGAHGTLKGLLLPTTFSNAQITDAEVWVSLHTATPGNTGANEVTAEDGGGRTKVTAWTLANGSI